MASQDNNLIKINQRDIKAMLEERILNPKKYIDKPLLIWRGYFDDDILRSVFFNFDSLVHDRIRQHDHEVATPKWEFLKLNEFDDNRFLNTDKEETRVYCFILEFPEQPSTTTHSYETYSDFINKDWLARAQERLNSPIVVYLPFLEHPDAFPGYDQYIFEPDFDEWKEELSDSKSQMTKHLVDFLESFTNTEERQYRWYWYFQRQKEGENPEDRIFHFEEKGCDFPSCWMEGLGNLRSHFIMPMAQIPKNYVPPKPVKISEIPEDEFKEFFNVGISEDVVEEFRNYQIDHDVEIQGNKRR